MKFGFLFFVILIMLAFFSPIASADNFDSYLHDKAYEYQDWLMLWHSGGLGGVSDILFTDQSRTEIYRTWGAGDSTDWTATYLVSQAIRYIITGEQEARDEVVRIAHYLHIVHDITGDPGYLARYAAPDVPPWNVEYAGCTNCYPGEGIYEGYFWQGHQSRDKYMHWYWGLTWAYIAVDDPDMRQVIQDDFVRVLETLISNNWTIIDPWGATYPAADIGPDLRLSFILQTAHVTQDPYWWSKLDDEYEMSKNLLWITTIAFFNKYMDYYAFINSQAVMQPLFSLWPDKERLEHIFKIWKINNRQWQENTHNVFFDAVYYGACMRLGNCPVDKLDFVKTDSLVGLNAMYHAPNYQREKSCPVLPLDPFSVFADQILAKFPWLENLINIDPQTAQAHRIEDRCWVSVLWESSPYHLSCDRPDDPAHVTHGMDYLIGYWLGVYFGMLPGDGPYGDDDLTDDDDDNDDNDDNDDDDDDNDDDDDDDISDDDRDDDSGDDEGLPSDHGDSREDDGGCRG